MKQSYEIRTCCGDHVDWVDLEIPEGSYPEDYESEALDAAGIANYVCGGCYDWAFHVRAV